MSKNTAARIYIRMKRDKSIYFFECGSHDNIDGLKRRLAPFYKNVELNEIRLYLALMKLLDDKSNIHDQDVRNDSLIHFKLRKPNGGQWEDIADLASSL